MSKIARIIVTGATGQDGSYMIDYLLAHTEHTLIAAVRRTSQAILGNLTEALKNPRVKLVTVDLCDGESIRGLIRAEKPDYFINFGAQTFVADSWANPVAHMRTNAIALIHILESIREYVPHCRFYSAGSSEQWGDVKYSPQDERHPMSPRSVYGVSKCAASHLVKVYRESYGLYAVHGILLNHESERRQEYFLTRKVTKGVARLVKAIKTGESFEPIELGNLDAKRDWSHAEDFVDGIWRMLNQEVYRFRGRFGMLDGEGADVANAKALARVVDDFVLASDETHTVRGFVEKACVVAGFEALRWAGEGQDEYPAGVYHRHVGPNEVYSQTHTLVRINPAFLRPADVVLLHGDSTRARTELDWAPKVSFDELVRRMVEHDLHA